VELLDELAQLLGEEEMEDDDMLSEIGGGGDMVERKIRGLGMETV